MKKFLAMFFSVLLAVAFMGIAVVNADGPAELKFAPDPSGTQTYDINLMNDATWGGPSVVVSFQTSGTFGLYQTITSDKLEYTNAYGERLEVVNSLISLGNNTHFLIRIGTVEDPIYAMVGDTITFKQGFKLIDGEELPQDVKFIVTQITNHVLKVYQEGDLATSFRITNDETDRDLPVEGEFQMTYAIDSGYGTPYFTSSDSAVATVTKQGLVSGVSAGEATITGHLGSFTADFNVVVREAQLVQGMEIVGGYTVWVAQGDEFTLPEFKARAVFQDGSKGVSFDLIVGENIELPEVDTDTLGETTITATVTYKGDEYSLQIPVNVYEIGDVSITEVGIVDWFAYSLFIQYPNSTINNANITNTSKINGVLENLEYKRADGTIVPINGYYMLVGGNIALFLFNGLNADNYNQYYQAGDILTIKEGLKIWLWTGEKLGTPDNPDAIKEGTGMYVVEGILQEEIAFRYDGNVWGRYLEYTDITVRSETLDIKIGEKVDAGVSRVPSNATTGEIAYTSSNESIATVSSKGSITGVKEGTVTITATITGGLEGEKTVTITVNVSDFIEGLSISPATIIVNKGGAINLESIEAKYKFASGKLGDEVDLSGATISGFDKNTVGEQTVVISITVNGKTYSGTITVNVRQGGCKGDIGTLSASIIIVLLVSFTLLRRKRHS